MNTGVIIMAIGFGLAYVIMQIVPLIDMLLSIDKQEIKEAKFDDWMLAPLFLMLMLIPIIGALFGGFIVEDSKWLTSLALGSLYTIVIGLIIALFTL